MLHEICTISHVVCCVTYSDVERCPNWLVSCFGFFVCSMVHYHHARSIVTAPSGPFGSTQDRRQQLLPLSDGQLTAYTRRTSTDAGQWWSAVGRQRIARWLKNSRRKVTIIGLVKELYDASSSVANALRLLLNVFRSTSEHWLFQAQTQNLIT